MNKNKLTTITTQLTMRPYDGEDDYWRIRAFLREVYLLDGRHELGWQAARLDYWRWHMVKNVEVIRSLEDGILLWETNDGRIGAVVNIADERNEVNYTIHPQYRVAEFTNKLLATAEKQLGIPGKAFFSFLHELDTVGEAVLRQRGYGEGKGYKEYQWRRNLTQPLPDVIVPEGYIVRAIGDVGGKDWSQRSWVSWRAFHPNDPDEDYGGWEWSLNWACSPLYRRDLDIVAIDPEGKVAAYCVCWYDDTVRTGLFDPVAVSPEHQQRGLGKAITTEAMRRAQAMGATLATVSGFDPGANGLYRSTLSPEHDIKASWVKTLPEQEKKI